MRTKRRISLIIGLAIVLSCGVLYGATALSASAWRSEAQQRLDSNSQLITTSSGIIEYVEVGQGPAILALHGTPGGYDSGIDGPRFTAQGFRYLSRPGYLRTPLSTGQTIEQQADAYAALLDALDIQKAAVIAGSGGGPSALQFALRHPDRCSALVLISALTQPKPQPEGAAKAVVDLETTDMGSWLMMKLITERPEWVFPALDPDLKATGDPEQFTPYVDVALGALPMSIRKQGLENDFLQFSQMGVYPLEQITCPTLIIHGTADINVPLENAEYIASSIPGAQFIKVEQGTHYAILTHEAELMPQIAQFLQAHLP